jgi:hypothetical protein
MLLFQPENVDALKARFEKALTPIYTMDGLRKGVPRPYEQRKHVFDYDDGTRLVVSHEMLGKRVYLHCTGSMDRRCQIRSENFDNVCYTKICALAGRTLKVQQTDNEEHAVHLLLEPLIEP